MKSLRSLATLTVASSSAGMAVRLLLGHWSITRSSVLWKNTIRNLYLRNSRRSREKFRLKKIMTDFFHSLFVFFNRWETGGFLLCPCKNGIWIQQYNRNYSADDRTDWLIRTFLTVFQMVSFLMKLEVSKPRNGPIRQHSLAGSLSRFLYCGSGTSPHHPVPEADSCRKIYEKWKKNMEMGCPKQITDVQGRISSGLFFFL